MQIRARGFNIYLLAVLATAIICGCQSPEKKAAKKPCFFRVHMEATSFLPGRVKTVTVFRQAPTQINVEPTPFVTEEYVREASVIDSIGGYALKVEFNREGRYLLEQFTSATANKNRRLVIFSHFIAPDDPKLEVDRWLAAPRISQAITNGMLVFAPDASREEAERIAQGLRNSSKKLGTAKEL